MTKSTFLEKARSIHGYKYNYKIETDDIKFTDILTVILNDIEYEQRCINHLQGKCPEKLNAAKSTDQFINESKAVWGHTRFDYTHTIYINAETPVILIDTLTGLTLEQIPIIHLKKNIPVTINQYDFIEMSKRVADFSLEYDQCTYINKTTKVDLTCSTHGQFSVVPFNHLNYGTCCPKCSSSTVLRALKKPLNKLYIPYNTQKKFDGCNDDYQLPFDIYIPSILLAIDINTIMTSEVNNMINIKSDYCDENFIDYIIVNESTDIASIINNYVLSKLKLIKHI